MQILLAEVGVGFDRGRAIAFFQVLYYTLTTECVVQSHVSKRLRSQPIDTEKATIAEYLSNNYGYGSFSPKSTRIC